MNDSPLPFRDEELNRFRTGLLRWYEAHARILPWRNSDDPYHIWVSEIMLQQTRVEQARPYFERFIGSFPTVKTLAEAELDDVLLNWEGLGYYSRARNMHKAARRIVSDYGGELPESYEALLDLPGIGPYTAAAIVSIAFNKPYGVLDGNVIRVLSRLTCNGDDTGSTKTRRILQSHANILVDPDAPGDFNQALMELGATCCVPKRPTCMACPVQSFCCAYQTDRVDLFPAVKKKTPVPHYDVAVGVLVREDGAVLIRQRPNDGLLGGLWEFPSVFNTPGERLEKACRRHFREELDLLIEVAQPLHSLSHAYSHFKITVFAFLCYPEKGTLSDSAYQGNIQWVPLHGLDEYALHRAHRRLANWLEQHKKNPTLFGTLF